MKSIKNIVLENQIPSDDGCSLKEYLLQNVKKDKYNGVDLDDEEKTAEYFAQKLIDIFNEYMRGAEVCASVLIQLNEHSLSRMLDYIWGEDNEHMLKEIIIELCSLKDLHKAKNINSRINSYWGEIE